MQHIENAKEPLQSKKTGRHARVRKGLVFLLGIVGLAQMDAHAQGVGSSLLSRVESLESSVAGLQATVAGQQTRINALEAALDQERAAREALEGGLTAEATARVAADVVLTIKVEGEAADRQNADGALQASLQTQASNLAATAAALTSQMNVEASERQAADGQLQASVQTAASNLAATAAALSSQMNVEVSERQATDGQLQASVQTEAANRAAADVALTSQLAGEAAQRQTEDETLQDQLDALGANDTPSRLAAVEEKLAFVSVQGTDMLITGANLYILNGLDSTETQNGLGNLIVGYNERVDCESWDIGCLFGSQRTGSHNLIVGRNNTYQSYGAAIFGRFNKVTGPFSSVTGGENNAVKDGVAASISGGSGLTLHDDTEWAAGSLYEP